jgi:hypothetical protein
MHRHRCQQRLDCPCLSPPCGRGGAEVGPCDRAWPPICASEMSLKNTNKNKTKSSGETAAAAAHRSGLGGGPGLSGS